MEQEILLKISAGKISIEVNITETSALREQIEMDERGLGINAEFGRLSFKGIELLITSGKS